MAYNKSIINGKESILDFSDQEIKDLTTDKIKDYEGFRCNLGSIISCNESNKFVKENLDIIQGCISQIIELVKNRTDIHRELMNKYLLSESLNLFLSNGA